MSLKPLGHAAVFPQPPERGMLNAPLTVLAYEVPPSSSVVRFFSFRASLLLAEHHVVCKTPHRWGGGQEVRKPGDDCFGITVLLEYGM